MTEEKTTATKAEIRAAINEGKAVLKAEGTKIDAAMAIYTKLKDEPRETVVQAFIEGASLTEKGAVTYWYNCRRKYAKSEKVG